MSFQNKTKKNPMNHKKMKKMPSKKLMMKILATKNDHEKYFSTKKSSDHTHTDCKREVAETTLPRSHTIVISVKQSASRETTTNAASNTVEQDTANTVSPERANSAALTTGEHATKSDFSTVNVTFTTTEKYAETAEPSSVAIGKSLNDSAFADLPDSASSISIIDTTKQSDSYLFLHQHRNQDFVRENGKRKFVFVKFLL